MPQNAAQTPLLRGSAATLSLIVVIYVCTVQRVASIKYVYNIRADRAEHHEAACVVATARKGTLSPNGYGGQCAARTIYPAVQPRPGRQFCDSMQT